MKKAEINYEMIANFISDCSIFKNNVTDKHYIIKCGADPSDLDVKETIYVNNDNEHNKEVVTLVYNDKNGDKINYIVPMYVKVDVNAKLRLFLYLLARDHLPLGNIEEIMLQINRVFDRVSWAEHWDAVQYNDDHINNWADDTISRLMNTDHLFPDKKLNIKECVDEINKGAEKAHGEIDNINKESIEELKQNEKSINESSNHNQALKDIADSTNAFKSLSDMGIKLNDKKKKIINITKKKRKFVDDMWHLLKLVEAKELDYSHFRFNVKKKLNNFLNKE